ncbi:MAG: hypothetical protein Q7S40_03095 [Opitutaceae bacterium]|nr:hypothetical protein [Opitutaceae bacterium]
MKKHVDPNPTITLKIIAFFIALAAPAGFFAASPLANAPLIIEAETGKFTGGVDRHSCWHNVMLTDAPHSTHSGKGSVDTKNEIGSYIECDYEVTLTTFDSRAVMFGTNNDRSILVYDNNRPNLRGEMPGG